MRGWLIAPLSLAMLTAACSWMNDHRTTASDTSGGSASGGNAMASQSGSAGTRSPESASTATSPSASDRSGAAGGGAAMSPSSRSGDRTAAAGTSSSTDRSSTARSAAPTMSKDELRQAQTELKNMGLYDGEVDGIWGPRTRAAVGKFQSQNNLPQTYALDSRTRQQLQSQAGSAGGRPGSQIGETPRGASPGTMEAPPIESPQPPQR